MPIPLLYCMLPVHINTIFLVVCKKIYIVGRIIGRAEASPPSLTTGAYVYIMTQIEGKWACAQRRRGLFLAQAQLLACQSRGSLSTSRVRFLFECDFSLQRLA